MSACPLLDRAALPDFAHVQHVVGSGKVFPRRDLLGALTAHAEQFGDLVAAHEVTGDGVHATTGEEASDA